MPLFSSPASPFSSPHEIWTTAFNELSQRMRRFFIRSEAHQRALAYAQGLMGPAERKNGWQVSEAMGETTPYASVRGYALVDRELYLPKSWTDDQQRCQEAHVPEEVTFATKPQLAQRMLERTLDAGLPVAWITGDTVYGSSLSLRTVLETRRQAYALAVACKEYVEVQGNPPLSFAFYLAWSCWRRAHQALARLCHYKRRCALASHLQL